MQQLLGPDTVETESKNHSPLAISAIVIDGPGPIGYTTVMSIDIPQSEYDEIERTIGDDTSPVGIDAKKTHILILHKLISIEKRLEKLENKDQGI